MHEIQRKILDLAMSKNIGRMKLREIGYLVGEPHPQKIKHHLNQLEKRGLIKINKAKNVVERIKTGINKKTKLINIPILGSANCGEATFFADKNLEGYLKVSSSILTRKRTDIFALKTIGSSMNKANIQGNSIEDGDFLIVDCNDNNPQNNDYVVSIIDSCANVKKFLQDDKNNQIVLVSESTQDFPPIYIHPNDDFRINGKVVQVIKKPQGGN